VKAIKMVQTVVFWADTNYSIVREYHHSWGTYCLHFQGKNEWGEEVIITSFEILYNSSINHTI
jgi:hypothetical protein